MFSVYSADKCDDDVMEDFSLNKEQFQPGKKRSSSLPSQKALANVVQCWLYFSVSTASPKLAFLEGSGAGTEN